MHVKSLLLKNQLLQADTHTIFFFFFLSPLIFWLFLCAHMCSVYTNNFFLKKHCKSCVRCVPLFKGFLDRSHVSHGTIVNMGKAKLLTVQVMKMKCYLQYMIKRSEQQDVFLTFCWPNEHRSIHGDTYEEVLLLPPSFACCLLNACA